jgi:hypothetical protein
VITTELAGSLRDSEGAQALFLGEDNSAQIVYHSGMIEAWCGPLLIKARYTVLGHSQ